MIETKEQYEEYMGFLSGLVIEGGIDCAHRIRPTIEALREVARAGRAITNWLMDYSDAWDELPDDVASRYYRATNALRDWITED